MPRIYKGSENKLNLLIPLCTINTDDGMEEITIIENGEYEGAFDKVIVNVPDLNGSFDDGYDSGVTDGQIIQKGLMTNINITENGTYTREDGYNEVIVDVPDLNGSYDDGYSVGKTDGYNEGYEEGFSVSYDEGYNKGQEDIAINARVIDITENGVYASKFTKDSDYEMPYEETGDDFWSYATVKNNIYNTGIIPNANTRLEFWFKPDEGDYTRGNSVVIMNNNDNYYGSFFGINQSTAGNQSYNANVGGDRVNFNLTNGVLYHIILSVADGLVINGEQIGTFSSSSNFSEPLYINGESSDLNSSADGEFGMIKIDDTIIIPTENGFLNQNTNELLEVVYDGGSYKFTERQRPIAEGELYKTITVNVIPKISVKDGLRIGYSTFSEVPEWADFEGVTDMTNMFRDCYNLTTIPEIDTRNVTNMSRMFQYCSSLQTIPEIDTRNVTNMSHMFQYCSSLQTLPTLNAGNVTDMDEVFESTNITDYTFLESWEINPNASMNNIITNTNTTYVPAIPCIGNDSYYQGAIFWAYSDYTELTYFGGWIGRKYNITNDSILPKMPNLSYESCISILNNLFDFVGNGETPSSSMGQLKVHQNFLDTVGDEISIGTNKGWTITA